MKPHCLPALAVSALALMLPACSSASEVEDALEVNGAAAAGVGAKAVAVSEETEVYSFEFSYPAAAAAIPALKQRLDADLEERKATLLAEAQEGKQFAAESGYPYNAYGFSKSYEVVADLPRFLSLSESFGGYSGGAHGYYGSGGLVWDREAGKVMAATDFFTSPTALEAALGERYCGALNRERAKKREGYEGPSGMFEDCVGIDAVTLLPGSSDKQHFDRIGLIADPYVAGPWSEGSYEVTLPVDAALLDAVKPEYRAVFTTGS